VKACIGCTGFLSTPLVFFNKYNSNGQAKSVRNQQQKLINHEILSFFIKFSVRQISFGFDHCLILTNSGKLASWGYGLSGCLGHGNYESCQTPKWIESVKTHVFTYIECGGYHNGGMTNESSLYMWGRGDVG